MHYNKLGLGILSCTALMMMITSQASAQLHFSFDNDSPFDLGQGIGATQLATAVDGTPAASVLNVTTVDIFAPEFADDGTGVFTQTGNTLSASAGDAVTTQTNSNSLGVDNPSISDDDFFAGAGIENRDINDGEGWVVSFDADVTFTEINFSSLDDGILTVTIPSVGTFTIVDEAIAGDAFADPFGTAIIPAGTPITFDFSSPAPADSANVRINSFTVTTGPIQSVLLGDVNLDNTVNFLDISPFIAVLSAGSFQAEADTNEDSDVTFLDISPFIGILSGS